EARKPHQHRPDSRLPSEPPLDGIKESDPFGWRLEAANARQQYGRYKTDAADPQDDRKNVQRAGNRNIIHLPSLDLRRSVGLREAGMTAKGMARPCSGPASKGSWQGAPKTRSMPCHTSSILRSP